MSAVGIEHGTLASLRRMLLAVIAIGLAGLGTELLLLGHVESPEQIIAPALVGAGLAAITWNALYGGPVSLRVLQAVMLLFVGAGLLGMYYHYAASVEFQREMDPSAAGMALFWKAMAAKAPPSLAPGAMAQLGLMGLLYAFRHPALAPTMGERRGTL